MRSIIKNLWPELDREDIAWGVEAVAFEFLAISCLVNAAIKAKWKANLIPLPEFTRIDNWCMLPKFNVGFYGQRSRHASPDIIAAALMPRIQLKSDAGQIYSVYYQGFPPMDSVKERPDWIIVPGEVKVTPSNSSVNIKITGKSAEWSRTYGTSLTRLGPLVQQTTGELIKPTGFIEVSLKKDADTLINQIKRYEKTYSVTKEIAFLGYETGKNIVPTVVVPRRIEQGLTPKIGSNAGLILFNHLFR